MPCYDRGDILMELIELCHEIKSEILLQLSYYRASVYKSETLEQIEIKIKQLQLLAELCGNEALCDAFRDYEEVKKSGPKNMVPGECFLSHRLANFFQSIETMFEAMLQDIHLADQDDRHHLTKTVLRNRHQLLLICRQGSRPWQFFSGI